MRWWWTATLALGFVLALGSPAGAGAPTQADQPDLCATVEEDAPAELAEVATALAAEFQTAIDELVAEEGLDPAGVPDLIGEPGDADLPPGASSLIGSIEAVCASDLPGGGASALTGPCQGVALSFGADGSPLDAAGDFSADGPPVDLRAAAEGEAATAFTSSNPFEVDVDGFVLYAGTAGPPGGGPRNHDWEIVTLGIAVDSGGDDNPEGENASVGSVDLGSDFPAKVNGLFYISGDMVADGGFLCEGHGYFRTTGGAPVGLVAGAVIFAAAIGYGALFNTRPAITGQSTDLGL